MNKIRISIFLFLFTFFLCIFNNKVIDNITEASNEYMTKIEQENNNNDIAKIEQIFNEFKEFWEQKSQILNMLIHHDLIDKISENISELKAEIDYSAQDEISKTSKLIKSIIKSIKEIDNLSLENLL